MNPRDRGAGGGSGTVSPAEHLLDSRPDAPGALLAEAALSHALGALRTGDVPCAVIKGIPLARRLYGQVDARGVPVDADLLVRHCDVPAAVDALIDEGYSSPYLPLPLPRLNGVWKVVLRRVVAADVVGTVELHWAPFSPRTFPLPEDLVWRHLEPFETATLRTLVPDRELTLVLLACHFAQSGLAEPRLLRDLATAWNGWGSEIDLATLLGLVDRAKATAALDYAFCVAEHRGLLSVRPPQLGTPQARWASHLMPEGRVHRSSPDYPGQVAALALCHPTRLPVEVGRFVFPSRAWTAVACERPLPSPAAHAVESAKRLGRIVRGLLRR